MPDDFPRLLDRLLGANHLSEDQAHDTMGHVLDGRLGPERLAALIVALRAKGPHVDELVGFARAMRDHSHRIDAVGPHGAASLRPGGSGAPRAVLDNCGTGGAPRKAFNVSTAAAFALAGADVTVAKHGNRSVTRPSGSADVLETAGARLDLPPERVEAILRQHGIAFLFAPAFHPAMRHAGPVRQALGIRTVFNLLGPLTNPAGATHQVLGVHDPELLPTMAAALARLGCHGGFVLHGHPGYDEATPTGLVQYVQIRDGAAGLVQAVDPKDLGIARCRGEDIAPVAREAAPALLRSILTGTAPRPVLDTVALNMAFALVTVGRQPDLAAAIPAAHDILSSGVGNAKLDAYLAATREPHE